MPENPIPVQLPESWKQVIGPEFAKPYMQTLADFLHQQKSQHNAQRQ